MTHEVDRYQLRDATADDFDGICRTLYTAFGANVHNDEKEVERLTFEPERNHVVTHEAEIVATAGAYTRDLTVPGAMVPAAHVAFVAVQPTHRRHGLLSRLMDHQLHTVSEPIAVLWATEGRIYQRFGYGLAARSASMEINTREVTLLPSAPPAVGGLRATIPAEARKEMQQVYERSRALQPGRSSRGERWWDVILADPESRRRDATTMRVALFSDADGASGYALWRAKSGWNASRAPSGQTKLIELVAVTPAAYAALWRFLLSIDLARTVTAPLIGAEEPIWYLVNEPRQLNARLADGLWLRVVDLPAALEARRYAASLDVVFEVTDALLPANAGRWRLQVSADGSARCSPAAGPAADLECDIADLGAAYLGGTPLAHLAFAGRVRQARTGALAEAAAAFSWHVTPTATEIF